MNLLMVEDDGLIRALVQAILEPEGHTIHEACDCAEGRTKASEGAFDAMILDVNLPDGNGYELLAELRKNGLEVPVMMLTSLDGTEEVIRGLDAGAGDYLTKPFEAGILTARVRALLRRGGGKQRELSSGRLHVDRLTRQVEVEGQKVKLTPKEYMLLEHLLRNKGTTIGRAELLKQVWNLTFDPGSNVVDAHMARLRSKLSKAGVGYLIETVRGDGFQIPSGPNDSKDAAPA